MGWSLSQFANLHSHKLQSIFRWGYYKYNYSYNCYRDVCDQSMREQTNVEGHVQGQVSNSNDFINYQIQKKEGLEGHRTGRNLKRSFSLSCSS